MSLTRHQTRLTNHGTTIEQDRPLRVASVPASHVYVRHLRPLPEWLGPEQTVTVLPDPDPTDSRRPAGAPWWPPAVLEPQWIDDHADEIDLVHLQFGFDHRSPEDLAVWVDTLRRHAIPLLYTVHDLRNPHHADRSLHDAQLDVLVPAASGLITLTPGAAAEIRDRWGREARVLPHPHVIPLDVMDDLRERRAARRDRGFTVGLHIKSLRASMDPVVVLPTLLDAVADIPGGRVQVNGHRDVLGEGSPLDPDVLRLLRSGAVDLRVHDFLPDEEFWTYLAGLDASVLPYRFGTHSGWLEGCRDVGTAVVAPSCGYYADQGPVHTYELDEDHFDPDSLMRAVHDAWRPPEPAVSVAERVEQRTWLAAAHAEIYRRLVS